MSDAGVAFVQLVPSMRGFSGKVTKELGQALSGPLKKAGNEGGRRLGTGISDGMGRASSGFKSAVGRFGDIVRTGMKTAGLAAGALLVVGLTSAFEREAAVDKLTAQLGGGEWAAEMGEIAGNLYNDAFGESIAETGQAVRSVVQAALVEEDDSAERIEEVTELALTFGDIMDQDVHESVRAVSQLMRTGLARNAEHGFDLLTAGAQNGLDASGDLLEVVNEYSTQFRELGITGEEAFGLLQQMLQGGARDTDTAADALKEFAIRGQDMSATSATAFESIGLNAEEMFAKMAAGGPQAREGLQETIDAISAIEDPTKRNAAAVALFGTKAEDLQDAFDNMDLDTATLGDIEGRATDLGEAYDNAATRIESFKRTALDKVTKFIGNVVIPAVERLVDVVGPVLASGLETAREVIGSIDFAGIAENATMLADAFMGAFSGDGITSDGIVGVVERVGVALRTALDFIQPIFEFLINNSDIVRGALLGLGILIAAIVVPALVSMAVSMVVAAAPFLLVVAAAAAVGAALVWLFNNVEEFRNFVQQVLPQVGQIFMDAFELIKTVITTAVAIAMFIWRNFGDDIIAVGKIAWNLITGIISGALDIIQGIIRLVTSILKGDWSGAWDAIKQITSGALTIITSILRAAWGLIKVGVSLLWRGVKNLFWLGLNAVKALVRIQIDRVVDFFRKLPGRVRTAFSTLSRAITSPFRSALDSLKRLWNNSVGGFGFTVPDWIPGGVGGRGFTIPNMHTGGVVPGPLGSDVPIIAQAGEGIFTRAQMAAIGAGGVAQSAPPARIILSADGETLFLRWIKNMVSVEGGGDVNVAFGGRAS